MKTKPAESIIPRRTGLPWLACALAAVATVAPAQSQTTYSETVLHSFSSALRGAYLYGGVVGDGAGNLYGTASSGGTDGLGILFKVDAAGRQTVLYNFVGVGGPYAGAVRDATGNFYGTTPFGGIGWGTVYKVDAAGQETDIHTFSQYDGANPYAGVIRDAAGNLYGTTYSGGAHDWGVVYKLDAAGNYTLMYSFTGGADGGSPYGGLTLDSAGNLYGTTQLGGAGYSPAGAGVVFKVDVAGHETVLYTFTGGADGGNPQAGVIRDSAGNLYGTAELGGTAASGVVYKLDHAGHYTVLHNFAGGSDGALPYAGVIIDAAGNLYGTTIYGGTGNAGVVYKVTKTGQETVLYAFTGGADGGVPYAGLIRDSAGNLYGTTYQGGSGNVGVVYKVDAAGHQRVLYSLPGAPSGSSPGAGVIRGPEGNTYGTTISGGAGNAGVVYKLDATRHETVLYSFSGGADGGNPSSGVIRDPSGNLYGTTDSSRVIYSDNPACGVVYRLDPTGHETVLHTFTCGADGAFPEGGLTRDSAGNLYGTTYSGGAAGQGVVYKLDTAGNLTVLYSFTGKADGGRSTAGVIRDSAGNLYGTTTYGGVTSSISAGWGVVYKLDTTGHETVLYAFTGGADGGGPYHAGLVRDPAGNLYGTTFHGGTTGAGVVFKVDPAGNETVLYSFTGGADGGAPTGGLLRDSAGNLYGTANTGVVYKVDPAGNETVLYTFTGGTDGNQPVAGVIQDSAGNLFGTTYQGGRNGTGVVFKLTPP